MYLPSPYSKPLDPLWPHRTCQGAPARQFEAPSLGLQGRASSEKRGFFILGLYVLMYTCRCSVVHIDLLDVSVYICIYIDTYNLASKHRAATCWHVTWKDLRRRTLNLRASMRGSLLGCLRWTSILYNMCIYIYISTKTLVYIHVSMPALTKDELT